MSGGRAPNGPGEHVTARRGFGSREVSCPRILLWDAPQTKPDDDCIIGSRGPGANEGDFLLMPHLTEIHPGRFRGLVCELIAGYK